MRYNLQQMHFLKIVKNRFLMATIKRVEQKQEAKKGVLL
jgi:hypothetical protein